MNRPNILIVHCHDLGQFLHCYGVQTVQTPNLDAFAAQGVRFPRSFCTSPSCSPSRASIFTGRYPHNNGVMGLCHGDFGWDLNPDERHLGQILADAGYATAAVGTIHETRSGAKRCGYQQYVNKPYAAEAATETLNVLEAFQKNSQTPFYLSVGFMEPHRLPQPHPDDGVPGEFSFPGTHLKSDDTLGTQVPGYLRDTPGARRELAGLQGAVRHVDEQFGRIIAGVRHLGLEQNTLVMFTTDHGIAMPRAKCSLYEPGLQTALILRLPSRPGWGGGRVLTAMVSNIDDLPTILDAAGVGVPANVQGRSLAPMLDGGSYTPRDTIFSEMTYHNYYDPMRAVRTETHKLIVSFTTAPAFMDPSQRWRPLSDPVIFENQACGPHKHVELYDLARDPWEQKDVADSPEYAAVRRELLKKLHEHLVATDDPILRGAVTGPHHRQALALLTKAEEPVR